MNQGWKARPPRRPGAGPECRPFLEPAAGYSLIELMFVAGLVSTLSAVAVPTMSRSLDHYRVQSAVRYMSSRLQGARVDAVTRGGNVALQFTANDGRISFTAFEDGNGNGVSTADIDAGIDPPVSAPGGLADFPGVDFGLVPGVRSPEGALLGTDPIRFGNSRMASFTPHGTATAGSVYIRGRDGSQYVVRVYGDTGKITILRFDRPRNRWVAL